jgi:hypothetical protein
MGAVFIWLFFFGFIALCFQIAPTPDDRYLNLAIFGASVIIGWLLGTLISAGTSREEAQFGKAAKAISAFASGYVLAKIDNVVNALLAPKALLESANLLPAFRLIMSVAVITGAALWIYIVRAYILDWALTTKSVRNPPDKDKEPSNERNVA